jgi:hypothetical protein
MKGDSMGRKAEVAMYRIYATEKSHRYVRIVKSGRGWAPKTEPVGIPGSFYLRYAKNGRRTLESVGEDLQSALQEQKNRSQAFSSPPSLVSLELGLGLSASWKCLASTLALARCAQVFVGPFGPYTLTNCR